MRASDIVRGKIQYLRNRAMEERPPVTASDFGERKNERFPSLYRPAIDGKDESVAACLDGDKNAPGVISPTNAAPDVQEMNVTIEPVETRQAPYQEREDEEPKEKTTPSDVAPRVEEAINAEQEAHVVEAITDACAETPDRSTVERETPEQRERDNVRILYQRAQAYLHDIHAKVIKNEPIDVDAAISIIKDVIALHYDLDAEIYQMTVDFGHGDDYFFAHAINTAIYAVRIGQRLGYSEKELMTLGVSALLCDIGMFKIPDQVLNKRGKLTSEEVELIKRHPQFSQDILLPFIREYPEVVESVLEHQERENGQGYPRGLKGDEIVESAKIIGICDSYEAMTHNRPHKKALMQTDSIRELIGSRNQLFSPKIIKVFLDEISIFPVGSYVRLNNKKIGRVIATNRSNPLKPTIKILFDEGGSRYSETEIIDLKANPVLNVEGSVAPDELP